MEKEKLLKDVQEYLRQNRGEISSVTDEERRETGERGLSVLMSLASKNSADGTYEKLRAFSEESEAQHNKLVEFCYEKTRESSFLANMAGPLGMNAESSILDGFIYKAFPDEARQISVKDTDRLLKGAMEYVGKHMKDPKPCDVIVEIMESHNLKASDVYGRAQLSRQAFSKIIAANSKVTPKKTTLWCIIMGLKCDIMEADRILNSGGYIRCSEQDRVLEYFIDNDVYDLVTANFILDGMGLPLLTTESVEKGGKFGN
ncbi:MAG: hypothetical protein LUD47_05280 [Clostridia bacterium]|nr:hypothetical protein [Clostridia bacterium]